MRKPALGLLTLVAVSGWAGAFALRAIASESRGQDPAPAPPSAAQQASADELARQAYAILKQNCFECHGAPKESGLDLRTEAGLQAGGRGGKVVVAHKPAESRLYKAIMHDGNLQMPDGKDQLPESDRDVIKRWIESGASLAAVPEAVGPVNPDAAILARREERPITDEERNYWAFKIPVRPAVRVDGTWSRKADAG